jgi:hypothetical protein
VSASHPASADHPGMNGRPARYAIRVAGRLGATSLAAFPDLHCEARESETVLTGEMRDGPALYGIIALLEALGLDLIEVKPLTAALMGGGPSSRTTGDDAVGGRESGALR